MTVRSRKPCQPGSQRALDEVAAAPLVPGRVDVTGVRAAARSPSRAASAWRMPLVLLDRALERLTRSGNAEVRSLSSVHMDRAHDRPADLPAGNAHQARMKGEGRSRGTTRSHRSNSTSGRHSRPAPRALPRVIRAAAARAISISNRRRTPIRSSSSVHLAVVLESDAEHHGVEQVPGIPRLHRRTTALLDPDQPALFEQLHPFTDDGPAETELLGEHSFRGKERANEERARDDPPRELVDDDRGKPAGATRTRRVERQPRRHARSFATIFHAETSYVLPE